MSTKQSEANDTQESTRLDRDLLQRIIEGALMAAAKPMSVQQLAQLFDEDERPANDEIQGALEDIQSDVRHRGFELQQVASGYRFQVVQDVARWVSRMWDEKPQKYSRALLETLSLIAYRQPITRGDIEDIRGVAVSSHIIKTLMEREWIRIVGHKDVPGRPAMFATTRAFLDYFNLKNLDELPSLAEIRDLDSMNGELALEGADTPAIDNNAQPLQTISSESDAENEGDAASIDTEPNAAQTDADTQNNEEPLSEKSAENMLESLATDNAAIDTHPDTDISDNERVSENTDVSA